ncbi:MAG TPA: ABC transporter ATP-binding protein [Longimicrobiales bacterium]|nr:ABC transporter ATP-binding protein [Longimicrobiales bacterium]
MKSLKTLLPYVRVYRASLGFGLVLVIVANALQAVGPRLVGLAIDAIASDLEVRTILLYAGAIVAVAVLGGAARYGMRELLNGLSRRVEVDLRDDLFAHFMRLDASFYGDERTGDLMARATNDTANVRQAVGPAVMYMVNTIAGTIFALAFMLSISARLTALSLIPLVVLPPLVFRMASVLHRRYEAIQEQFSTLTTMVQENLSGARIVRAYGRERAQEAEFGALADEYLRRNMALARVNGLFRPSMSLLAGFGMVLVLWLGGRMVMSGAITAGDFVAFFSYLGMLVWPMIALGWVTSLFQRGAASMARINAILHTAPRVTDPPNPLSLARARGELEFRDVSFRYPGTDRDVLSDVSFRVEAGRTVALVGPTGAGKSTVVALLARLYDPTGGAVLVDGIDVRDLSLARLRAAIGVVPQESFMFSDTIRENLRIGVPEGEDGEARIEEAVRISQLQEAIESFPAGLDTRLGERGVNLSGGQRQRAALARALARDPEILVLDDALSAVDTHTEARILEGLERVLPDRTAVIVSHRVTAVKDADEILVLDEGRLVERGTHARLLGRAGLYARLLRRQLLEEAVEEDAATLVPAKGAV